MWGDTYFPMVILDETEALWFFLYWESNPLLILKIDYGKINEAEKYNVDFLEEFHVLNVFCLFISILIYVYLFSNLFVIHNA